MIMNLKTMFRSSSNASYTVDPYDGSFRNLDDNGTSMSAVRVEMISPTNSTFVAGQVTKDSFALNSFDNSSFMNHSNSSSSSSSNNNSTDEYFELVKQPLFMLVILSISYGIVFLLALLGNLSVIAVVARDRSLHTATNFFLVNLAVADMLVAIICLPITLLSNIYTVSFSKL
ncbi:neuropeptide FF receptor 2 [Aplysia californica]|uniref:Neuropeptide FF receptor 2 n=1 Tax=Aplysia californica TaxID=6500 RepID=A0ABM1VYQ8_APLCA|nr:neuropeptide FF receptor 2 [Aplysia californica]XP_035827547.1 neuropeptide FF receptor 2 [Aplysia californica]XP_035827548.1 neuropeptide FF receptor 2 [Aplysia californica]XP_035827549.1 neuropeptide FF receptor 2 [Aplysia californica]XP_035827550.1 neuropeptide FF receptor 2 [Aplysia californica]XP_035827551.1 neuropeptide FF receptor 2 [Aplysia californica]XP_035827552.1 neuropeptide FF receptor 2 [Aplysia californica]XP_035827553.1 neuropeptide FF receptor 2 [Aplysia californica]XP_